jgi:hypothetical protein
VARIVEGEVFTGFWFRGPKARDHWEEVGVGGRITLRWTLGRWGSMGQASGISVSLLILNALN